MTDKNSNTHPPPENILSQENQAMPELALDRDKYRDDLTEYDYTPEQENQMLQAIWDTMNMMADLGWGVDSVHMIFHELFENNGSDSDKLIKENISEKFNPAVNSCLTEKETKND